MACRSDGAGALQGSGAGSSGHPSLDDSITPPRHPEHRFAGTLLGTALGDALGIAAEGLPARAVARRFGELTPVAARFRLCGGTGFVSDDTEQAALVAESLARAPADAEACAR